MNACKHGYYYQCPYCEKRRQQKAIKKALKQQRKDIAKALESQAVYWYKVYDTTLDSYYHARASVLDIAAQDILSKRI